MEKITTDISTFESLRKGGYVYVNFCAVKRNIDEPAFAKLKG